MDTLNTEILLRTKISVPPTRPDFVSRPRLTARINAGIQGPLTLLSAPAGFGKTQLLAEWATESIYSVAWLTLSSEDNDYVRFFRYLGSAFQEVEPQLYEAILDYVQTTENNRLAMATLLINEVHAIPKDLVLVLDEYHVLTNEVIIASLNFLLKNLSPNLHIVIASRSEQALDLALLRAKGQVTEIGVDDLRFTYEEIEQFFKQTMRLQLPLEVIQIVEERTEGWIIGLQLAALSLRNTSDQRTLLRDFHGDAHYLVDFLAQEVLHQQPEDIRHFLLRSSILDVFCGPLCEAVVGLDTLSGYGIRMLDQLEHLNMFITPLDGQHQWFRFHNLFGDFLRHMLTQAYAEEIPDLHKRAATWFEQHGNFEEASKHALASGDMEWAANLMDLHIELLIETGKVSTLTHWIKRLPRPYIYQRPRLGLAYAWGLIASHQLDDAQFWLDEIQQTLDGFGSKQSQPTLKHSNESLPSASLGGLVLARSMLALARGNFQQAAEYSREAVSYLREGNLFIRSMLSLGESMQCILRGEIDALQETVGIARQANNLFVHIVAICQLAEM